MLGDNIYVADNLSLETIIWILPYGLLYYAYIISIRLEIFFLIL